MSPAHSDAIRPTATLSHHTTCPPEEVAFNSCRDECPNNHVIDSFAGIRIPGVQAALLPREMKIAGAPAKPDISKETPATAAKGHSISDSIASTFSQCSLDNEVKSVLPEVDDEELSSDDDATERSLYSTMRVIPTHTSAYLRPGSRFEGNQHSDTHIYRVVVDLKHVDIRSSFLCGYLNIRGLTGDQSEMTTYFEGEIIGDRYGFLTRRPDWESSDRKDLENWHQFPAWRPYERQARKASFSLKRSTQREHVFMRWKEHFLVPDNTKDLNGASFAGFYYICMNQISGVITGIYFHAKDKKTQKLELKHMPDGGRLPSMEFR